MNAISAVDPAPSAAEPAAPPPAEHMPEGWTRHLPLIAVCLAVVASFMAVMGLVAASRTIANASLVVADARERQAQLKQVSKLIEEVEELRAREQAALERIQSFRSAQPATSADVNRAIDKLKIDLASHNPQDGTLSLVRDGQAELAERLGQISLKVGRIEERLNASRKASPAAGRAPTS
jgi:hypothetical protein